MGALDQIVRSGKALYVGISNYGPEQARAAIRELKRLGTPCLIHQPSYSMLNRWIEDGLTNVLREEKVGCICFAPLANGLLTGKYLDGIPADSRMAKEQFLKSSALTPEMRKTLLALNEIAARRGQTLAEMALAWCLKDDRVTSVIVGASRVSQLEDDFKALENTAFSQEELNAIDQAISDKR
jgi:L-glyceraldehyde 3-phosphate reductase